ncbi:MAG: S8 family peptidase [Opitutales bacterium]
MHSQQKHTPISRKAVRAVFVLCVIGLLWLFIETSRSEFEQLESLRVEESETEAAGSIFEETAPSESPESAQEESWEEHLQYPPNAIRDELVIHFDNSGDYYAYLDALAKAGFSVQGQIDALLSVRIPTEMARRIHPGRFGGRSSFSYVVQRPSLPNELDPGALSLLRGFGNSARAITSGGPGAGDGSGVLVAVLDSGLEAHAQFEGLEILELDLSGEGLAGPGSDHGTSVASIIAGSEGVAPNADLMVVRVFNEAGQGSSYDVARGIVEAVDQGAKIINMSLGVYQDAAVMREAVKYAVDRDVLLVAAAGNDAIDVLPYPAAYEEVLAVTAVDAIGQQAIFPNQSTTIDFAAPGVGVIAAGDADGLIAFSGTSAAAPFVSGTLAALMSGEGPLTPQAAVDFLDRYANEAGAPGDDPRFGGGVLDWDRMKENGDRGVVDVALASVYIPPSSLPGTLAAIDVTVENRGTQWLDQAELQIAIGDQEPKTYPISSLTVGETTTRRIYAEIPASEDDGLLQVRAQVLTEEVETDVRLENNMTAVRFLPAPQR